MRLYTKIILWLFLNLVILGVAFYAVFRLQFHFNLDSLLMSHAGDRLQAVSEIITTELGAAPETNWNEVLKRFSQAYKVQFSLFRSDGTQAGGDAITLPPEVLAKVNEYRGPFAGMGRGPPPGKGAMRAAAEAAWVESRPKFMVHTAKPSQYWAGACLPLADSDRRQPRLVLLAHSASLHGGGLFLDLRPWIAAGFAAVLLSVLLWFPLVRGITRAISQMNQATEQIAIGRFDARVQLNRRDELGRLGQAINRMADRLAGFVGGQKRFLGDIAHELCSPIARIQMALGILERQAGNEQQACLADMREDVQQMSQLVNELLSFSKAALQARDIKLVPVNLAGLVARMVAREAAGIPAVTVQVDPATEVLAEPELLSRAVANLLRNAVRYAGEAGPITIAATTKDSRITLTVADSGPGVPPEVLQQIFDPFFRVESSRSRDSGGVGLGLAIVKTCVEACQGTVSAQNRQPSGLQVSLVLNAPSQSL
jgi:two-component system sensor histidine kinase CpxA